MSKKCEWKGTKAEGSQTEWEYSACIDVRKMKTGIPVSLSNEPFSTLMGLPVSFCPFCGADIRKPEPEVIIKESGGTWVYKAGGIDYFVDRPQEAKSEHCLSGLIRNCGPQNVPCAKPISEITITDEIAKLRPIVIHIENKIKAKLYGVEYTDHYSAITDDDPVDGKIEYIRLATVSDLP